MKKKWKRKMVAFIMLCITVMLLYGCGTNKDDFGNKQQSKESDIAEHISVTTGYKEIPVQLPNDVLDILAVRYVENNVWMVTDGAVYLSEDFGSTWEKDTKKTGLLPEMKYTAANISEAGRMAFALEDGTIQIVEDTGVVRKTECIFGTENLCYTIDFVDEKQLLAMDTSSNMFLIDLETLAGREVIRAEGEYYYLAAAMDDVIWTLAGEGVKKYSTQGELQDTNEAMNQLMSQDIADFNSSKKGLLIKNLEENGFYYACKRGLYHYALGGSITEQLVDGVSNSMGDSECNFYRMAVLPNHEFLIAYRRGASDIMMKKYVVSDLEEVTVSETIDGALQGELTVYTLRPNLLLEQEINTINQMNSACTIHLEVGLTDEGGMTEDDAVKALNTELLAGNGPDIIILDGMPVEKYCESGLLLNLSEVLNEVKEQDGLYQNIAYTYEQNGEVYAVPARFQIPIMLGNKNSIEQIIDIDALVSVIESLKQQYPDQTSIVGLYGKGLLECMFDFCAPQWVSDTGELNKEGLTKFLQAVQMIENIQKRGVQEANIEVVLERYVYADDNEELDLPGRVVRGEQSLAFYHSKSLNFSKILISEIQDTDYTFDSACGQSNHVYIPKEIVGVNARGQNQAAALAFVKEFLSSTSQSKFKIEDTAYPLNKRAFQMMKEEELKTAEDYGISREVCEAGFDKMEEIIDKLSISSITDTVIRDTVIEQGMLYLDGSVTVEEATDAICSKVSLHMAE